MQAIGQLRRWLSRRQDDAPLLDEALVELPWTAPRYVVFDCEMTGLDAKQDELLSLGAVEVIDGRVNAGNGFYQVIRPQRLQSPATIVHQLGSDELARGAPAAAVLEAFATYLGEAIVVGHFTHLDLGFVNAELTRQDQPPLPNPALDTRKLYLWYARRVLRVSAISQTSVHLPDLARRLKLPAFAAHHALGDALTTATLFIKLATAMSARSSGRVLDLMRIGGIS